MCSKCTSLPLRVLLVEDEKLYRLQLESYILELDYELVGSVDNSKEATQLIKKQKPDIVIMDIKINGSQTGIQVAKKLKYTKTVFLFVTSMAEKEIYEDSKNSSSIGFLVKPFDKLTLQASIENSQIWKEKFGEKEEPVSLVPNRNDILIRHNTQLYKVLHSDILYLEMKNKVSIIHTKNKKLINSSSLSNFLSKLPKEKFIQIHKSYIVNRNHITKIISKDNQLFIEDQVLPIGRAYKENFMNNFEIF